MKKIIFLIITICLTLTLGLFNYNQRSVQAETSLEEEIKLDIVSYNISHSDAIFLALAVKTENLDMLTNPAEVLFFNTAQEAYTKGNESYVASCKGKTTIDSEECFIYYSNGLAAKQMTDIVYARAYVKVDEQEYYSEPIKYSVLDYIYDRKAGTLDENNTNMFNAMLEYGAYAQKVFNYNTDHLANGTYYSVEVKNGTLTDGFTKGRYLNGEKVTLIANKNDEKEFIGWYDDANTLVGTTLEVEVIVNKNVVFTAIYKEQYIENIDVQYDATIRTLDLPKTLTINNEEVEVIWDTTTFVEKQIGEQVLFGQLKDSAIIMEIELLLNVNVLPFTLIQNESTKEYTITKYYGTDESLIIPSTYRGKKITSIGSSAFSSCSKLISIETPSSITSIGSSAFSSCSNLKNVYYHGTVSDWCNIIFKNSTSNPMYYAEHLYFLNHNEGYYELKTVEIPNDITTLEYSFFNIKTLESVTFEENSMLSKLGNYAFYGCNNLISITIPKNEIVVNDYAFAECNSLENVYYEGTIDDWCNITFKNSSSNPMSYAEHFYMKDENNQYNEVLELNVQIQDMTKIGRHQFSNFKCLKSVFISKTVTMIDAYAFNDCVNLETISFADESELTSINSYAFQNCTKLTNFIIPESVTTIGLGVFKKCASITTMELPKGIKSIGLALFNGCTKLESVLLPDNLTSIGGSAFNSCTNLSNINIPASVTSIGSSAFYRCSKLTSIAIPEGVTKIESSTFASCKELTTVTLHKDITSIDNYAFSGCYKLANFVLPENLTKIGKEAFASCMSLTSIVIPNGVLNIEYYAFGACYNLEKITLPNNLTTIGEEVFYNCGKLTSIFIPASVASIGESAFIGCEVLTINCEATSMPSGWNSNWNPDNRPVIWGISNNN